MFKVLKENIKKYLDDEKVSDLVSFLKFIIVHGLLGMFILLIIISIIGINFDIVTVIRQSYLLTMTVFMFGSGAFYYLLLDVSKFYFEMKGVNKR